ncbi:MAG: YhcN/YlaJ family sporulation lipoprotein [Eubacteriales bacterium]|nr:YhcN/YlaJ family sporulation lipoprotein [Eubacteriales bacterium]
MKKRWILVALCAAGTVLLASCASSADTMPSQSPSVSPSMSPTVTVTTMPTSTTSPAATTDAAAGAMTVEDAQRMAESVDDELEKLSELDQAEVVVAGNMALIGITYDAQYQGGMTTRLTDMVEERVMTVDKGITVVHVTDDEKIVQEIKALADELSQGKITYPDLQTRALEISTSIAGTGTSTASPTTTDQGGTGA